MTISHSTTVADEDNHIKNCPEHPVP